MITTQRMTGRMIGMGHVDYVFQQNSGGAGRSRIVVDLERQAAEELERAARERGGSGKGYVPPVGGGGGNVRPKRGCLRFLGVTAFILLLLIGATLAASYLWWRNYQQSPVYSLALLADAAQRDDRQAFDELIDAGAVTQAFLPQVRQQATGNTRELPPAVERQVGAAVERQLPNIEAAVRNSLRTTIADATRAVGGGVPFPVLVLAMRGLASDVQENGDAATVMMQLGGEQPTELMMRRKGERWQVIAVKDARIAAKLAEQLPSALPGAAPLNLPPGVRGTLERELRRQR